MIRNVLWSRRALRDLGEQVTFVAADSVDASARLGAAIRSAGSGLGNFSTGRPGRVAGTYEKSVPRLPYIIAYSVGAQGEGEVILILRVIHTARNWPVAGWPKA